LKSKKKRNEVDEALKSISSQDKHIDAAIKLHSEYEKIYSVTSRFRNGIINLPEKSKKILLDSITITNRNNAPAPNEEEEKLDFLYQIRNYFTHNLNQDFRLSNPLIAANLGDNDNTSWWLRVEGDKIRYPRPQTGHNNKSKNEQY